MQRRKGSRSEVEKNRKMILKEKRAKRRVKIQQTKVERKERKEKLLREVMIKIGLKQEKDEEGIVVEMLLDSKTIRLVISEKFARKHKFRRTKLERPIYVRNVNGILNYVGLIVDIIEVEIYSKRYKERTLIDITEG